MSDNTIKRLMAHIALRDEAWYRRDDETVKGATEYIRRDVEEVKVAVMTHCFAAMDFFGGKQ